MAESIEMPFEMWTWVDPRKHVLDVVDQLYLANTIELSVCSSNEVLCQVSCVERDCGNVAEVLTVVRYLLCSYDCVLYF